MNWKTTDPFLFCAYHQDDYPEGNENMGPNRSLEGRHLGRDFEGRDNWRMYHGRAIPGFPRHPHRGFETVTVVRTGMLDHADSMGATARYGGGDVQWLTSGHGIQHAEMFPLLRADQPNPLELFQIWLNLPRKNKMVDPHFTMLWNEKIPRVVEHDEAGRVVELTLTAGRYKGVVPQPPPPDSWATPVENDVAIWAIRMEPGARFELPPVLPGTLRSLYVHSGAGLRAGERQVANNHRIELEENGPLVLVAGASQTEVLLLQGRPIDEPLAQRGPFVMNTQDEIRQAYADFQSTGFGGWPWQDDGPVHGRGDGRFARHADGSREEPT
ncbi:MAG: pirin family protein [Bradymonadaceae bacterium]|nr:pirin family protein [Lujinxingiaceae bacterium]